jgi:predicted ATPase
VASNAGPGRPVIGREHEIAVVSAFLDSLPLGPRALVLEGEAGIGKSTVWFEAVRIAEARGYRVLRARPAESEARLSYAALADLIGPAFDDARAQLPGPQELALAATLLRVASTEAVDPRTAATAVVGVLTEVSRVCPVLIAIDDVQWVDLGSQRALEFAARRLPASLGQLITRRSDGAAAAPLDLDQALPPDALQRIVLASLSLASLHYILRGRLGSPPTRPVIARSLRRRGAIHSSRSRSRELWARLVDRASLGRCQFRAACINSPPNGSVPCLAARETQY